MAATVVAGEPLHAAPVRRRALHAAGFRFRLRPSLPGRPDLVPPRFRIAVFVHGCFWHWHTCMAGREPKSNASYWSAKIVGNVARDEVTAQRLVELGWASRVLWECQLAQGLSALVEELCQLKAAAARANPATVSPPWSTLPSARGRASRLGESEQGQC